MGHEDNGPGAVLDGILDGGQSTNDTLGVGDRGVVLLVKGNVEVDLVTYTVRRVNHGPCNQTYSDQDTLVLEIHIGDGKLAGERHC